MSGVVKSVKKVFKKVKKELERNKVLKTIVVAAAVWFTVGTATAYFAAPEAGLGAAMSSSASSMWASTTQFFGAEAAATGNVAAQQEVAALVSPVESTATALNSGASISAVGELNAAEIAAEQAFIDSVPTVGGALQDAATGELMTNTTGSVLAAAPAATPAAAPSGLLSWVGKNPVASMMLGQAGVGAYSGYLNDKQLEREEDRYRDRGLMGFDYKGNAGGPGVVRSQTPVQDATRQPIQAAAAPVVAAPQVPGQQRPVVAVPREQLPELNKSGQIARG
jgi:hypothetical protein